jgi:sialate O-acetylesterase
MKGMLVSVCFLFCFTADAQIRLPALVRDSMVLQRDTKLKIWGWASSGENVKIHFNGRTYKTKAGIEGKWIVFIPAMKAGGPYTMDISGKNKITLKDVLIGDVWFCSGQSNMVHQLSLHDITYATDIAKANYPLIRHFTIATHTNLEGPVENMPAAYWKPAIPKDLPQFSAVAYFFARKIFQKYQVPIGLINASVGGTPIEAWTSEEGLKDFSSIVPIIRKNKDTSYVNTVNRDAFNNRIQRKEKDKGLSGPLNWYDPNYVPKGWQNINIPGYWEDQGAKDLNGIVWYRREIFIPDSLANVPASVFLGRIIDADILYINGIQVGKTTYQYPQRRYRLPAGMLKPGRNLFVIRVSNTAGKGGFVPDKPYYIQAGNDTIDLKGSWQYKVGEPFPPATGNTNAGIVAQTSPTALYNAMVAPVVNYAIKGVLWYQGESNAENPAAYQQLLPALINDWRNKWALGNIPFLYVQLPNYMDVSYLPSASNWALLREAALKTLHVPNTHMTVAIDLGEWNDIHPDNKKDVGERLALGALKLAYGGKSIVSSGPIYQSSSINGNKISISFSSVGGGLISVDGDELSQFAIAGSDKKFIWAKAIIEGDKVVVWNDEITQPVYVRYAWSDNPFGANLYNKEKLPASPFRTDE